MRKCLLLLVILVIYLPVCTSQIIYVHSIDDELFALNLANCSLRPLVLIETELSDITFHPNGTLYGIGLDGVFFEIDTLTGATNPVYQFSGQNFNSLTADLNGVVYATGTSGDLWSYDFNTSRATHLGNIGFSATGDLTFYRGDLYAAVTESRIVRIDLDNMVNNEVIIQEDLPAHIFGIVSHAKNCSDVQSYAITAGHSDILQIAFEDQSLQFLCELDIEIGGGASTFEFFASASIDILNIDTTDATCGQDNGRILVEAQGGEGDLNYSIDGINFQSTGNFEDLAGNTYQVIITDDRDCQFELSVVINQDCPIYIPNAFSPNEDGENDLFQIYPHPLFRGQFKSLQIFNRWGGVMYQLSNFDPQSARWDGTYRGRRAAEGVYVYSLEVEFENGKRSIQKGELTLLR